MRCTVEVGCKPYVKRFIENNCGDPADLRKIPELHNAFMFLLKKKTAHYESMEIGNYQSTIKVLISEDDLYRYGWELTKSGTVLFNRKVERLAKFVMRQFIGLNSSFKIPVSNSIREFQEKFGYTEDEWSYESIKKDFDRNGRVYKIDVLNNFKRELQQILMDNLSDLGTLGENNEINLYDG